MMVFKGNDPEPPNSGYLLIIKGTLWLFNIAMENNPFIDGLPIIHGDFPSGL